jgi:RimJ/RimL family protein N-acetyltransferase
MSVAFSYGRGGIAPIRNHDDVLSRVHTLRDGTLVRLRHLGPDDAEELAAGFARLSPESRYRRFFSPMPRLPETLLRRLTATDGYRHVALIAESIPYDDEPPAPVGVARFIRRTDKPSAAEVAVTVIDELHGQGLGRLLLQSIAALARESGVTTLVANVLSENAPMRALLSRLAPVKTVRDESGVLVYEVPLR